MKKSIVSAIRAPRLKKAWESQPSPIQPAAGYLSIPLPDSHGPAPILLCDPLTGLVAYPSFESLMIAVLPRLAPGGLHLAIGDVDDLRGYVSNVRSTDPTHFGHLAGNDCMRRVGEATRLWAADVLDNWPFAVCATFGGDEVIVAAAGRPYDVFLDALSELSFRIHLASPRPCSFASATTVPVARLAGRVENAYRRLVSHVDRCLFRHKGEAHDADSTLDGALVEAGVLDLLDGSEAKRG